MQPEEPMPVHWRSMIDEEQLLAAMEAYEKERSERMAKQAAALVGSETTHGSKDGRLDKDKIPEDLLKIPENLTGKEEN
jgi:hypothetical protein